MERRRTAVTRKEPREWSGRRNETKGCRSIERQHPACYLGKHSKSCRPLANEMKAAMSECYVHRWALEPFSVRPGTLISGYIAMDSRMGDH